MTGHPYRRPDKVIVYLYRRTTPGEIEYLLLQRTRTSNAGQIWQTVVGGVEWNEDLVEATRREVFEETGLTRLQGITAIGYVFSFPVRMPQEQPTRYAPDVPTICTTVFAARVVSARPIRLSREHVTYDWFPYQEAMNKIHWPEEREALALLHPMLNAR